MFLRKIIFIHIDLVKKSIFINSHLAFGLVFNFGSVLACFWQFSFAAFWVFSPKGSAAFFDRVYEARL